MESRDIANWNNNNNQENKHESDNKFNCSEDCNMKDPCGVCGPFLSEHNDDSEEIVVSSPKNMISDIHDIVKVESIIVTSPSKLDCIVEAEEKKEEDASATTLSDSRDAPIDDDIIGTSKQDNEVNATPVDQKDDTIIVDASNVEPAEAIVTPSEPAVAEAEPSTLAEDALTSKTIIAEPENEIAETPAVIEEEEIAESTVAHVEEPTLECDFDKNPTDLYLCLMRKDWSGSIRRCVQRPEEAKTWIFRKESTGAIRWKLLPIHAAIIFNAPVPVVDALLHAHLYGADCKDDQGMVPLHLAIRMNSDHTIVEKLVMARPNTVKAQDRKGRTPRVLADKQEACPQKLLVIQTLENVNTTTTLSSPTVNKIPPTPTSTPSPSKQKSKSVSISASKNETIVNKSIDITPAILKVFSAEEVEGVKHTYEMQMEKLSREGASMQNALHQKIEILENNAKKDTETIRTLEESVRTAQEAESDMKSKVLELESLVESTKTEKNNLEDSNKAVIVNLVSQIGALQTKLTHMTSERDTIASQMAESDEISKQEIAQRKLRCLELERQLGQVTYMKDECEEALHKAEDTITAQKGQISLLKEDVTKLQTKLSITETKLEEVTVSEQELAWQNHALSVTGQMYAKNTNVGNNTEMSNQIKALEKERDELRETVNKLSVKLYKVVGFLDEMVQEQEAIITETLTRDNEMMASNTSTNLPTNVQAQPSQNGLLPMSDDRMKLLSNVSGMKEQIIGVIDSVIESMPQQPEEEEEMVALEQSAVAAAEVEETEPIMTKPLPLP